MADEETLLSLIQRHLGPAPNPNWTGRAKLWGIPFNDAAAKQYDLERHAYDIGLEGMAKQLIPQLLNPLRDTTLGEISQLTGRRPEDLATPGQFNTRTTMEPSQVPSMRLEDVRTGGEPLFRGLTPYASQPQPDLGQLRQPVSQTMQQFVPQEGAPLEIQRREPNLEARSTLPQQLLGTSILERETRWPRSMGAGAAARFKYNQIADAYGEDAANYWLAEGMLPGGTREQNLLERTQSSQSRGNLLDAQTTGQGIKNQNLQRQYDDTHQNVQSQVDTRNRAADRADRLEKLRSELMFLEGQIKQGRVRGDSPEAQVAQGRLELAKKQFDFTSKYVALNKLDLNDPTDQLLEEQLAEMAGVIGDVKKQPWYMRMFSTPPNVQRKPTDQPGKQSRPQARPTQPTTTPAQSSFKDAPPGKEPGSKLYDNELKRDVAEWDGKQWRPIDTR